MPEPMKCPTCAADLRVDPIAQAKRDPEDPREARRSRVIGLVVSDRCVGWECPDCEAKWPRTEELSPGIRTFSIKVWR